jgi:hypothetical protein
MFCRKVPKRYLASAAHARIKLTHRAGKLQRG